MSGRSEETAKAGSAKRSTAASERPSAGIVMTERALIVHGPDLIAVCSCLCVASLAWSTDAFGCDQNDVHVIRRTRTRDQMYMCLHECKRCNNPITPSVARGAMHMRRAPR